MVYSSQDGLTSGGHFLTYSTMHFTYAALTYDNSVVPGSKNRMRFSIATNAVHPCIKRNVTWMVLGLFGIAQDPLRALSWPIPCASHLP